MKTPDQMANNAEYAKRHARTPNGKYHTLLSNAKRRKITVTITHDQFYLVIRKPCYYCGGKLPVAFAGVDRINSRIGYTKTNVRPCCTNCNYAKKSLTEIQFITMIKKIYKHLILGE